MSSTIGRVEHVHVVRVKRGAPEPVVRAVVREGRGIEGDHHDRPGVKRAVTLIAAETIERVGKKLGVHLEPGASRRNVTVRGLDLDALGKGTRLAIGDAELVVTGPCDPCERMEKSIGPGALALMEGRGGLTARVLRGGSFGPGDAVEVLTPAGDRDEERRGSIRSALLAWFRASHRDLPWRRTRDPYAIWVSEVMLQQTQVSTVIEHWTRFLAAFPTVEALGRASQEEVLARWSGLGYYARARNMHRAAQAMVERHGSALPGTLDELRALPGFGPYTAGAIASIAFGLDAPLVDGNVARVFCRLEGWEATVEEATKRAWALAPELLARGAARDWNQGLMELGATVCTPANPSCDACPLRGQCRGLARGEQAAYPLPKKKPVKKLLRLAVLARREGDAVVVVKRDEGGLFGGLWELPSTELASTDDALEVARDAARALCGRSARVEQVGHVSQVLTHRLVEADVFAVTGGRLVLPDGARLVQPEALTELGIASLTEKLLRAAHVPVPDGHGRRRKTTAAGQGKLFG